MLTKSDVTHRVRIVLALSREEAKRLHSANVRAEHILLGLAREGESVAAAVVQNLGAELGELREHVEFRLKSEVNETGLAELSYSDDAKSVLTLAVEEATNFGRAYVGTEHLLLGLLRQRTGLAAEALSKAGVTVANARAESNRLLGIEGSSPREERVNGQSFANPPVAIAAIDGRLRLVLLGSEGGYRFLDGTKRAHRVHYVDSNTLALLEVVEELEFLINSPDTREKELQFFFERHQQFILGERHTKAHAHLALEHRDGRKLIPDFVLEPVNQSELCDVLDIKLPSAATYVATAHGYRLSAVVMDAVRQVRAYRDFFEDADHRAAVQNLYGLHAFRPSLFVVIGRRGEVSAVDRRLAQEDVPAAQILTYDDLLDRVKARVGDWR